MQALQRPSQRPSTELKKVHARPHAIWGPRTLPQTNTLARKLARTMSQVKAQATLVKDRESSEMEKEAIVSPYPTLAARTAAFTEQIVPEQIEELGLEVKGQIPKWLSGTFVRNGPGTYKGMNHMFDGYGMLAKFCFSDGRVAYSNRYIETEAWKAFRKNGVMRFSEFATYTPIWKTLYHLIGGKLGLTQSFTDNTSVNIHAAAEPGQVIATTEVPFTYRVRLSDLAALQKEKPEGLGIDFMTAHPTLLGDGTLVNIGIALGKGYVVFRQDMKTGKCTALANIAARSPMSPSWVHDFPVTQNYVVVPDTPVTYNIGAFLGKSAAYCVFDWQKDLPSLFHLVPINGGEVKTVKGPPFMAFHYINAWESNDGKNLCVMVPSFKDPEMVNVLRLDRTRSDSSAVEPSRIQKITILLDDRQAEARIEDVIRDDDYTFAEFPRVNPLFKRKENRYAYCIAAKMPTNLGNSIAKFDMVEGTYKLWHEPGAIPGEPIMVPRPGGHVSTSSLLQPCSVHYNLQITF
eukprot:jgi/Botrbrau1/16782/Bobra.150_2s0016.2